MWGQTRIRSSSLSSFFMKRFVHVGLSSSFGVFLEINIIEEIFVSTMFNMSPFYCICTRTRLLLQHETRLNALVTTRRVLRVLVSLVSKTDMERMWFIIGWIVFIKIALFCHFIFNLLVFILLNLDLVSGLL